ncbi:MAG: TfoX/Sxy family protein [Actinomycetota bacterium]|nr:TfoX/Sxy family protein [Actinomycetota bacterium]
MAYDERLAERVRDAIGPRPALGEIKMFGGLCFTLNGNMCCGIMKDELMVRVAPDEFEKLLEASGTHTMDMMKGRTPVGFIMIEPLALRTAKQLDSWVKRGVTFGASLPPKKAKTKKRK